MKSHARVAVIGGGVVGTSVFRHRSNAHVPVGYECRAVRKALWDPTGERMRRS